MKGTICFLLLFLAACMPAEYITSIAPSPTPIPTTQPNVTPDPLLPTIEALLDEGIGTTAEGIADGELLRLVVGEGEDQVVVPGAFFDEEGKFLHVGSEQIPVEEAADRLELSPDGLLFLKNADGLNIAFFDPQNPENGFVFFDTPDALSKLTDEQKLALSPETLTQTVESDVDDGVTEIVLNRSNVSTVKPELVIYRDESGNAQMVHNLATGEQMGMREAGIVELDLVDGGKWEMGFFDDSQKIFDFIAANTMWLNDPPEQRTKFGVNHTDMMKTISDQKEKIALVVGLIAKNETGLFLPHPSPNYPEVFLVGFYGLQDGVVVRFIDKSGTGVTLLYDNPASANDYSEISKSAKKWVFK